jgi:hypothetical protein
MLGLTADHPEFIEGPGLSKGGRLGRSWFDRALLSIVEGLTTNGLAQDYISTFCELLIKHLEAR